MMHSEAMLIIYVHDLHTSYGAVEAVKGVSFEVLKGEVFGLLGPNGAGKTTILETIEGLRPLQRGSVLVNGIDVAADPVRVHRLIGVQLQHVAFFDRLTLEELLHLFGELYGTRTDPTTLLTQVGLLKQRKMYVKNLSGGQRQRFSIAAALVNDPVVVFLDEPTSGLDPQARHSVWELVRAAKRRGQAVVLTTHYIEEAEALCDRVAIIDEGRIVALDTPAVLIHRLLETGFKREVEIAPATLEDVFLHLTGRTLREDV
ncbi:MAG: ABC transporter ATP-binding protein [Herpetosiphonaceae bacterium]|nr:ABC transporter ATP-binding protein [Herpetosiphonaceae bacterium]